MKRTKYNRKEIKPVVAAAVGSAASILVGTMLAGAAAYVTLSGVVQERHMRIAVSIMQLLSMLAGGILALTLSSEKNIWLPLSTVLVQMLLLLAVHILFIDAPVAMTWPSIISAIAATLIFVLVQSMASRKGKFKYRKL